MEYNGFIACYLFNLIIAGLWVAFLWRVLDGLRFNILTTVILALIIHAICTYVETFVVPVSLLRSLMMPLEPLLYAFILAHGSALRKVFAVLIECVASCIGEMFLTPYAKDLVRNDLINVWADPRSVNLGLLLVPIVALLLFIASLFFTGSKKVLKGKQLLVFTAFPLLQFICLACIETLVYNSGRLLYMIVMSVVAVALIVADVILYDTMLKTEERVELETANQLLSKQLDNQLAHYDALTKQYENIRAIRHDIYHHLNTIKILLSEGKSAEASEYAEQLIPMQKYISRLGECQNPVVDAFLYNRICEAEAKGIAVNSEIAFPASLSISNQDLIGLFANIMDNAIEACAGMDNAEISIKAHISKGHLVVTETNPVSNAPAHKERRIPELERGIGFQILDDLAKRYKGTFEHELCDGRFELTVMLKTDGAIPPPWKILVNRDYCS